MSNRVAKKRKLPDKPDEYAAAAAKQLPEKEDSGDEFRNGLEELFLHQEDDEDDSKDNGSSDEAHIEDGEEEEENSDSDISFEEVESEVEEDERSLISGNTPSIKDYDDDDLQDTWAARKKLNGDKEKEIAVIDGVIDEDLPPGTKIALDSTGNLRYIYREIEPVYDSDDTDKEEANTIGNIPLEYYEQFPHIGYDINGRKIMRPAAGKALDTLLESIELPRGWTGLTDKNTGMPLNLTDDELEILRKMSVMETTGEGYDPYPPMVEYFTSKTEIMPLSAAPEPKRRFIPSKHEAKRVMKIVKAIREGRIVPNKPKEEPSRIYDIWADESTTPFKNDRLALPAPKLPPPSHDLSYNPPPEYLPTDAEKKKWEETEPEDQEKDYLPKKHSALRLVPGYDRFVKDRFERCLDLYLAPRVRRRKFNIDPNSLLPKLPSPQDLKPFPTVCATVYRGHEGRVRCLSVDPSGIWLATGGDDGTTRIWEVLTGREIWRIRISKDEACNTIKWRPGPEGGILAAAAGGDIYLIVPPIFDPETESIGREILAAGFSYAQIVKPDSSSSSKKEPPAKWTKPSDKQIESGIGVIITVSDTVKHIAWHRRGDYFATVSPNGQAKSVIIHQLSKHSSQSPFRKSKGLIQRVEFHPFKPILFVATQRYIRAYDLSNQKLVKTLQPGSRWISSIDIHPGGDNLIVGSYDKRLLWHDLDLSTKPYKTLRYHTKAIRAVRFHHGGLPLFCSASDDGTVQVFHGKVFSDLMDNALVVPLKVLRGHQVVQSLGVLDVDWHPRECWLFSAGADGLARMWN